MSRPSEQTPNNAERQPEREPSQGPRIYVASLSDYNAGILHGAWLRADSAAEVLAEGVEEMLAESPTTKADRDRAEEFAIHDFEGFGVAHLGEHEPLGSVAALARGIRRHGEAFAAWWSLEERRDHDGGDVEQQFEESYLGEYGSLTDYAEHTLADLGIEVDQLPGVPEGLRPYVRIDSEAWGRDLVLGADFSTVATPGGVWVFR